MEDKITIQNLDLYYSEFHALKDINMHIREKEITAFIGPSGCGKSTLLRCLNRMNDLVEGCRVTGKVLLNGDDIYLNDDVNMLRKRVGMVFQKPNPFRVSCYDSIVYGRGTQVIHSEAEFGELFRSKANWMTLLKILCAKQPSGTK